MDLADWVEEAESLLRLDGLWPEQNEERARGVLEEAALQGPAAVTQAIHALRRIHGSSGLRVKHLCEIA